MALNLDRRLSITQDFLKLAQSNWIGFAQTEHLIQYFKVPEDDYEAKIFLLTRLSELARELPMKAYASEETRKSLLDAIQNALDHYIEEEDEVFAESNIGETPTQKENSK